MVKCIIKGYIESTQSMIVIIVKMYRVWEWYDSGLMWFKYIKSKSSALINYKAIVIESHYTM